ncbi:hypothetical protein [Geoalkalibacter subterraneus]|uniref:Uncharacterized protein n=1 Tax=Geoalkalibacter subterraneus TaxID=483547 RepID=A0A0B5FL64_9BACT|nr:hypothetical protein [Geoalkalibacter subterraneus]AJF08133.1 hypothetical protein GSUB_16630 [Geoalkalibacter subterraneus]
MEKQVHLESLQANIRRYGWQSLAVRMTAAISLSLLLAFSMIAPVSVAGTSLKLGLGVILCMLLWITDGHFCDMQERYAGLYSSAIKEDGVGEMRIDVPHNLNAKALWRPIVAAYYLPIMGILAFISMGAK